MPQSTNLQASPYFDDYSQLKDFYRVLFKPGVPVQTRELNQLQAILQKQIERFGDNIFQKGTIVDGCHLNFHDIFPYVKVKDTTTVGAAVDVNELEGYYLRNSANLQAYIVTSLAGFESQTPNLNTFYVRYLNSGNSTSDVAFSANQVLTVFKPDNRIYRININNGSTGFSNSDSIVISSALAVQNSAGGTSFANGFYVGDFLSNGLGANVVVTEVNTTVNTSVLVLRYRPQTAHLASGNATLWTISDGESVVSSNTGGSATVVDLIGDGAAATLKTDSIGKINQTTIVSTGSGYYVTPIVSVKSTTANTLQISTSNLTSQNFKSQITIAPTLTSPIGSGYGLTVTEGVIFQRGFFQRVEEQLIVVERYANTPDLKVVGFTTEEQLINSNIDESLLDNATGEPNETGPGADRLKLTPSLIVMDKDAALANTDFFPIVEFSQGAPYKQQRQTAYNIIGKEMARRTAEEAGDFVVDQFVLNTKSVTPFANEASQFVVTVDPGVAYISGSRIETVTNFNGVASKGIDTIIANNASVTLSYGQYLKVKELAGTFKFNRGDVVTLYDTATTYLTSSAGAAITPAGNSIGQARTRSLIHESGTPGSPNAVYRLYLFDVLMNTGKNFADVRSLYSAATTGKAICDAVLVDSKAILQDVNQSAVVFSAGVTALKNANNITYTYRTVDNTLSTNTSGIITKTLPTNETFRPTGAWGDTDKDTTIVIPLANVTSSANIAGSVVTSTSSPTVTGTSTTFTTVFSPGDYIRYANTTANGYGRVYSITNNTILTLAANASITISGANAAMYFPQLVPVNMTPSNRTMNVSANGSVLTINLAANVNSANVTVIHNVQAANVQAASKTVTRDVWVRIRMANNAASNTGPWALGVSDVFRLKNVYKGANNTFLYNDTSITDVTNDFYIDHNQNESFYNMSYLYRKPKGNTVSNPDVLLVKMDVFTTGADGLKDIVSYPLNDTLALANSSTTINTLEIPEMFGRTDTYYDLRDQFDFRPVAANTANVTANVALCTLNPPELSYLSVLNSNEKKFPLPGTSLTGVFEYYLPRVDRVVVDDRSSFQVIKGEPGKNTTPISPTGALTVNLLQIPAYPSLPFSLSAETTKIADTKIANERYSNLRLTNFKITSPVNASNRAALQPRGYKMTDIGKLESRISDLEYYIAFLLTQISISSKDPSNTDGSTSTNRFKYGYFTDPCDDGSRSALNHPEFYASFVNGRLVPKVIEFNLEFIPANTEFQTGDMVTIPFVEQPLITQMTATDGPVTNTTNTVVVTSNTSSNTLVQSITMVEVHNRNTLRDIGGAVTEVSEFVMSATAGPVQMYFNFRNNKDAIEVFQSTTPNFSLVGLTADYTSQSASILTTTDRFTKAAGMGTLINIVTWGFLGSPPKYAIENAGKLLWTHNPALGQYYKIVITKYQGQGDADGREGTFVYRLYYPVDSTINIDATNTPPSSFVHNGIVTGVSPTSFTVTASLGYSYPGISGYHFAEAQKFTITASGLKPSTTHNFVFEGANDTAKCIMPGDDTVGELISDTNGVITFDYYYDAGITEVTSDFEQVTRLATSIAGVKTFSIESSDGASIARGTIEIKSYVQQAINTPPAVPVIQDTAVSSEPSISGGKFSLSSPLSL